MRNSKSTAAERVSANLQERILSGSFLPGTPLREEELAREYEVSRPVVREALRVLASEGLLDYSAFRGVRIPHLTREEIVDVYEARRFIECGVVAAEAKRIDLQELAAIHGRFADAVSGGRWQEAFAHDVGFHCALVAPARSARIAKWHEELMRLKLAHLVRTEVQAERLAESVPQHAEIVVALVAGDGSKASAALGEHLMDAEHRLLTVLAPVPEPKPVATAARPRLVTSV